MHTHANTVHVFFVYQCTNTDTQTHIHITYHMSHVVYISMHICTQHKSLYNSHAGGGFVIVGVDFPCMHIE